MPDGVCKSPSNDNMIKKNKSHTSVIFTVQAWNVAWLAVSFLANVLMFEPASWYEMKGLHVAVKPSSVPDAPFDFEAPGVQSLFSISSVDVSCTQQVVMFFPLYLQEILFHIHVFMSFGHHCPVMAAWSRLGFLQLAVRWAQVTISCGKFNGVITYALGQINPTCKNADILWNDISLYQACLFSVNTFWMRRLVRISVRHVWK